MDAFLVLAEDLVTWELGDITAAMDAIGLRPRREGETAFPSSGDLIAEVRACKRVRRDRETQEIREMEEAAAKARYERERLEDGLPSLDRMVTEAAAKWTGPKPSLLGYSAAELRAMADAMDAGKTPEVRPAGPTWEERQEAIRTYKRVHGITDEMQAAARERVLGKAELVESEERAG